MKKGIISKEYIFALFAVFFWSFNVIVSKYFSNSFTPWQLSFGRWFFAMIVILPFTFSDIIKYRKEICKNFAFILSSSIIGIMFQNTFIYIAGHTISAIDMSLIGVLGPIFLIVFSVIFLKEKIKAEQMFGLIITIFGLVFVISRGNLINLKKFDFKIGDLWMLASSIFFGIYGTFMNKKPKELSEILILSVSIIVGVILMTPFFVLSLNINPIFPLSNKFIFVMIYMGVVNSLIAFLLWNTAINKYGSIKIGIIYYLMPIFSMIESHFILGEKITINQVYGGLLVILGISIIQFYGNFKIKIVRA